MKILIVNKVPPYPRIKRGTEVYICEVFSRLAEKGHQVSMVCGTPEPGLPAQETIAGIEIYYKNTYVPTLMQSENLRFLLSRYFFYPTSFNKIYTVAKQLNVDIIYDFVSPAPSMAPFAARKLAIPCLARVWEYFGRGWFNNRDVVTASIGYFAEKLTPRFPYSLFSTSSKDMLDLLTKNGNFNIEKMRFIPEGVDLDKFKPRVRINSNNRSPTIIHIGGFTLQKGHKYLFEAIPTVIREFPRTKFVFVGTGPLYESSIQQVKKLGVQKNVEFVGRLGDAELLAKLQEATIHVVSSLQECIPLTALEAMACGVPVVLTNAPGVGEIIQDGFDGVVVNKQDANALANGIIRLLQSDSLYHTIRANALNSIQSYGWDSVVTEEEKLIQEAIDVGKQFG